MRSVTWRLITLAVGLVQLFAWPSFGDDMVPPCWRGRTNTTFQDWRFDSSTNVAAPEVVTNAFGSPRATIAPLFGGWVNGFSFTGTRHTNMWELTSGGSITCAVPNQSCSQGCWKFIWVQVTQYRDAVPIFDQPVTVTIPGATQISSQTLTNETGVGIVSNASWVVEQSVWLVESCPASENVEIRAPSSGAIVDQVVVDTQCLSSDTGDVTRPCWRGRPSTTYQNWSFHNNTNPAGPEQKNNPGNPQATVRLGALGAGWQNMPLGFGCRQGMWELGSRGTISNVVPNQAGSASSYKLIQVQVVQYFDAGFYNELAAVSLAGSTLVSRQQQTIEITPFGASWVVDRWLLRLAPCPASETIVITAGTVSSLIDQVVVDTLCVDSLCPANVIVAANSNQCSRTNVTYSVPVADGCIITAAACTPPSGSTFQVGTNLVTCTITDAQGATSLCSFTVAVTDNVAPTITCPANISVARDTNLCGAVVNFSPTVSDNCPGVTFSCSPTNGSLFPLGLTTVTCTARDAGGNTSSPCSFTVRVIDFAGDVLAPCWRFRPQSTYQHWAFSQPSALTPEMKFNPGTPQATITLGPLAAGWQDIPTGFGCRQGIWELGSRGTMRLDVPNQAGSTNSYKYVRVQVVQYFDGGFYNELAAVTMAGGTLLTRQQRTNETTAFGAQWIVDQWVFRIAPCPASESILITAGAVSSIIDQAVVDTLCLDFACPADITASADAGQCSKSNVVWTLPALDGCVIASLVCRTNGVPVTTPATFPVGTRSVSCTIIDTANATRQCTFAVTVNDTLPPIISCPTNVTIQCTASISPTNPVVGTATATDNCGSPVVTFNDVEVLGTCPGRKTVTRTWKATDLGGLMATCVQTINVVDTVGPTVSTGAIASCYSTVAAAQAAAIAATTATDTCGTVTKTAATVGTCSAIVTVTATDGCSNSTSVIYNTRIDNIPPTVSTGAIASCYATVAAAEAAAIAATTATDNCPGIVIKSAATVGTCSAVITVTAADGCSNTASVTYNTRIDNTPPTVTAGALATCYTNVATAEAAAIAATTATDNCPGTVTKTATTVGTCSAIITVTATDSCGNSASVIYTNRIDNTPPTVTAGVLATCYPTTAAAEAAAIAATTATDNCPGTVTKTATTVGTCSAVITVRATDSCGNSATVTYTNRIDGTAPVLTCPAPVTVSCSSGGVATFVATATDNCTTNPTVTCVPASGSVFPTGQTTVNCTALDTCGNSSTCSFTVTVLPGAADLVLSMTGSPNPVTVGSNLVYKITVSNAGPCTATGIVASAVFPGQVLIAVTNGMGNPGMASPTPGAEAWWRAQNNPNDSADSHNGAVHGGVTFVAGEVGQAFNFDGLTGYVDAPDSPGLRPSSLTIEGWVKIQDPNGMHFVVSKPLGSGMLDSYSVWLGSGVLYASVADNSGAGQSVSYPIFPAATRFTTNDILNLQALATRLKTPAAADAVSQFVRSQLSAATLTMLSNYVSGANLALQRNLAGDLTRIIQNGSIYTAARFANVTLSPETQYNLARNPQGADLVRVNRLLLQDAYPTELLHAIAPQTTQWLHIAYTFDPVSQMQALFVNGTLVSANFVNKTIAYDAHALLIAAGNSNGSPGFFYQGGIDELALYTRPLIGTEIQGIYNAGTGGKTSTNTFLVGNLTNGATAMLWVIAVPTNCPAVSATTTLSSTSTDPNLANNVAAATVSVQDVPASQVRLTIERISLDNDAVRICWPMTCVSYRLQTRNSMSPPNVWTPAVVPIQTIGPLRCTILPASSPMQYFELVFP